MQLQRHARIEQIKHISLFLEKLLALPFYGICIFFPLALLGLFLLLPSGPHDLADMLKWSGSGSCAADANAVYAQGFSSVLKLQVALYAGANAVLFLLLIYHVRKLLSIYGSGEIFNSAALSYARRAVYSWCALVVLDQSCAWFIFELSFSNFFSLIWDILGDAMVIGFLFILIWSLEIGADLNQESELTI